MKSNDQNGVHNIKRQTTVKLYRLYAINKSLSERKTSFQNQSNADFTIWHWFSVTEDVENKLKSSCNYLWSLLFVVMASRAIITIVNFSWLILWQEKKKKRKYENQRERQQAIQKKKMQFHIKIDSKWEEEEDRTLSYTEIASTTTTAHGMRVHLNYEHRAERSQLSNCRFSLKCIGTVTETINRWNKTVYQINAPLNYYFIAI